MRPYPPFAYVSVKRAGAAAKVNVPALAGATVTFMIWNFVLVPVITLAHGTPQQRRDFLRFNCSFNLVNVHVLNLPFALAATALGGAAAGVRALHPLDLWAAFLFILVYGLGYLLVLDRLGVHLYPIFSPRTHACALGYSLVLALTWGCWRGWNVVCSA